MVQGFIFKSICTLEAIYWEGEKTHCIDLRATRNEAVYCNVQSIGSLAIS